MTRNEKIVGAVLAGLLLAAVAAQLFGPRPLDWTPSFAHDDARPYGAALGWAWVDAQFDARLTGATVYDLLRRDELPPRRSTLLLVQPAFAPGEAEARRLLDFAAQGGVVFAAARDFAGPLADTLGVKIEAPFVLPVPIDAPDTTRTGFVDPRLAAADSAAFVGAVASGGFVEWDSTGQVLGRTSEGTAHLLRFRVGDGQIVLSSVPHAFTNYHLLHGDGTAYLERALAYVPGRTLWWDVWGKPGRAEARSPIRYILSDPALRLAYWLAITCVVLLFVVGSRRRQRIIPPHASPRNATLAFVRRLGRLYLQHGDHADIARKRARFLLERIRDRYGLATGTLDDAFERALAERSGADASVVSALCTALRHAEGSERMSAAELERVSAAIERFRAQTDISRRAGRATP